MAKKKGGSGRFLGAVTGSPYERQQKQIDKVVKESNNDRALGKVLKKLVSAIGEQYEDGNIDEEEHDILIEAVEDVDPEGRTFPKLDESEDEFYMGDMPDSPELNLGKRQKLDDLMQMSNEFFAESDEAIAAGDHKAEIRTQNRVFADAEEGISNLKKQMVEESGLDDPNSEADEDYYTDDDGVEWWKDDDGYWWFREPGQEEWQPHDE